MNSVPHVKEYDNYYGNWRTMTPMTLKEMEFNQWLTTFVDEKQFDLQQVFEVESSNGTPNFIGLGNIIEAIRQTTLEEKLAIQKALILVDAINGDCLHYFKHLA